MRSFIIKKGLPLLLVLLLVGTMGAGYANAQAAQTCRVRSNVTVSEITNLVGGTGTMGTTVPATGLVNGTTLNLVTEGTVATPTLVSDGDAGDRSLVCTFSLIKFLANIIFVVILAISVLMLAYAAFLYVTAGARPAQADTAKQVLMYAVIGLVVAALARIIPNIVRGLIGLG